MPRTWRAANFIEPVSDSIAEQMANSANYCVVSGCAPSYSSADLTVTVGAGSVKHNGVTTTVAGSSVTLVPDATNPLWAWVTVNSSGAAAVTHGTAASNPTIPEHGDTVPVALILVEANQTIASNCGTKLDKRMVGLRTVSSVGGGGTAILSSDFTTASGADIPDLQLDVAASTRYGFRALIGYTCNVGYFVAFTAPTGSTVGSLTLDYNWAATAQIYPTHFSESATILANGFGASTPGVVAVQGTVLVGSTGGKFKFSHFANTISGTGGTCKAKSRIELY